MMSHLQSMTQRLAVTMLLGCAVSLAGLGASHAATPNASGMTTVNGLPCNELCKAYMSWSDRMMAKFLPPHPQLRSQARAQPQSQARTAVHERKLERKLHHAAAARRLGLNSFAQIPKPNDANPRDAAPQSTETPRVEAASPAPANPIADRFPAQALATRALPVQALVSARVADSARSDLPESGAVSATDAASAPQTTDTTAESDQETRFPVSLALALSAFVAFLAWGWFRDRTQTANAMH